MKQQSDLIQEGAASHKAADKGPKRVVNIQKDGLAGGKPVQSTDKSSSVKRTSYLRSHSVEDELTKEKVVKRVVGSAKDDVATIKETQKKSSSKAIINLPSEDRSTLVNGEAQIG